MLLRDVVLGLTILGVIYSVIKNFVLQNNDLKHIEANQKTMWRKFDMLAEETKRQGERLSRIEGRLNGKT